MPAGGAKAMLADGLFERFGLAGGDGDVGTSFGESEGDGAADAAGGAGDERGHWIQVADSGCRCQVAGVRKDKGDY